MVVALAGQRAPAYHGTRWYWNQLGGLMVEGPGLHESDRSAVTFLGLRREYALVWLDLLCWFCLRVGSSCCCFEFLRIALFSSVVPPSLVNRQVCKSQLILRKHGEGGG